MHSVSMGTGISAWHGLISLGVCPRCFLLLVILLGEYWLSLGAAVSEF